MEEKGKYQNAKIYKLTVPDGSLVYYGSTVQYLRKRLHHHKENWEKYKKGKKGCIMSFKLFETGLKVDIFLVEQFPCNDKEQLRARERFFIENNECVNKVVPGRSYQEWYQENKEEIKEKVRNYRNENYEVVRIREQDYNQNRRDKTKANFKYTCQCGGFFTRKHKSEHEKSIKHQEFQNR